MGLNTQFRGRLPLFCMWAPVAFLLLSTAASVWRQDVMAEQYSLAPDVTKFLDELKGMRNCGGAKGKMKAVCTGRNASFLKSPAMMDDWDTFKQNLCYCDDECHLFRDCCADVADMESPRSGHKVIKEIAAEMWSCEFLNITRTDTKLSQVSIHMVSSCPASSTPRSNCVPDNSDAATSYLADMRVMDRRTGVWFKNMFCAHCHGVVKSLAPMNRTLMCDDGINQDLALEAISSGNATYNPGQLRWMVPGGKCVLEIRPARWSDERPDLAEHVPGFYRPCVDVIDTCPSASASTSASVSTSESASDDSVAAERCPKFAYYLMKNIKTVYKNHYCALCNGVPTSDLLCWNPGEFRGVTVGTRFHPASLSVLMDYQWDTKWREGRVVAVPEEVYFDPIGYQCIPLTNSIYNYVVVDDRCVREYDPDNSWSKCEELRLKTGEFEIMENRSLLVYHNVKYNEYELEADKYQLFSDGSVVVCATRIEGYLVIHSSTAESILTGICLSISTICLGLHIITYSSIPKLKNLPGRNLLSLSWALFLGQFLFLFGVHPVFTIPNAACIVIAILIHYFYLAAFFWMSVMSYDIWRKFTTPIPESGHASLHRKYSVYAWVSPAVIVLIAVVIDLINSVPPYVRPNYGNRDICWFASPLGLGIFFVAPAVGIIIVNTVLFSTTVRKIVMQKRESSNYIRNQVRSELIEAKARHHSTTGGQTAATRSPTSGARDTVRLYLYVKLFIIMGLTWVIGFVAGYARVQPLWYPFIILNGLQGAFIFVMFSCKRSIGATMWDKTLGRRGVAAPDFLRAQGTSRSANSSMSTKRSRITSSGARNSRASSVLDEVNDVGNRKKVRMRLSDIVHEEDDLDKSSAFEGATKIVMNPSG